MAVHASWENYCHIADEAVWGVLDGTPAYLHLPISSSPGSIKATPINVKPPVWIGSRQAIYSRNVGYNVGGQLATGLFGWQDASNVSLAEHLIAWAADSPNAIALPSKSVEMYDGDLDNKRFLGNRVNTLTISGTSGQFITLTLDLIGQSAAGGTTEQTNTPATQLLILQSMMWFDEGVFELPSATALAIESFSLTLQNTLQPKFLNGQTIAHLTAGMRATQYTLTFPKESDVYDADRRTLGENVTTAQLILKGLHGGTGLTGTVSTVTIDLDRMQFLDATPVDSDMNQIVSVSPQYDALNPSDGSANDVDFTFGEAAT